ncbi:EthD domain-containing protein [Sphingomonas paeninsulae]|nr:EthD domain-containing protein [Sphingomonas paeninsulae]
MFKAICLIKRKSGMTLDAFIDRYEHRHAALCARLIPDMVNYVRRYVVTELWYEDRAAYEISMKTLEAPEKAAALRADEQELFDLASIRRFIVDERATVFPLGNTSAL